MMPGTVSAPGIGAFTLSDASTPSTPTKVARIEDVRKEGDGLSRRERARRKGRAGGGGSRAYLAYSEGASTVGPE